MDDDLERLNQDLARRVARGESERQIVEFQVKAAREREQRRKDEHDRLLARLAGPPEGGDDIKARVWATWNALPDYHPSPVKAIARDLGITTADVAAIVYPPEYGEWADDQEPDLP